MNHTPQQLARLPKWAQDRIKYLERDKDDLKKQLARTWGTTPSGSDIARMNLEAGGEIYFPMMTRDSLRVLLPVPEKSPPCAVRVKAHDNGIQIMGDRSISVQPYSSNLIYITTGRY